MVKVVLFAKDGYYLGFHSQGHAGFAPEGQDIVCAAVSVLTLNTVNALEHFIGKDSFSLIVNEKGGELKLRLVSVLGESAMHDAQILLYALSMGLINLQDTYSEFIKVYTEEVHFND